MIFIKRKSAVKLPEINGSVVDTFNVEDKTTNAPSIRAVEDKLVKGYGYYNSIRETNLVASSSMKTGISTKIKTNGGNLFVLVNVHLFVSGGNGSLSVYIDGEEKIVEGTEFAALGTTSNTSDTINSTFFGMYDNIPAGEHTVELYITPASGKTASLRAWRSEMLAVIEL